MYPKLSDLINDLFGTNINLPIQSYGFMVALAFLTAGIILYLELKRKEKEGLLQSREIKTIEGKPASWQELVSSGIIGFILGYKFALIFEDYSYFANNPQEVLISWGGNWIAGLVTGIGMVAWTWYSRNKNKKTPPVEISMTVHPYQLTGNIAMVAAIFGIIGAKLFDVIEHLDDFFQDPLGTLLSFSGLAFYGGFIVAAFAVVRYGKKHNIPFPHLADAVAPSLILAYAVGRIGCQISGDGCWGVVNPNPIPEWWFLPDWTWAFDYPHNVINEGILMPACNGSHCHVLEQAVYPTPFYETSLGVLIFAILWSIRKKVGIPGLIFSFYLILNAIERFLIERIRVNIEYKFLGMDITQAQLIAVGLFLLGVASIFYFKYLNKKNQSHETAA